jgi:hypothetical protein
MKKKKQIPVPSIDSLFKGIEITFEELIFQIFPTPEGSFKVYHKGRMIATLIEDDYGKHDDNNRSTH